MADPVFVDSPAPPKGGPVFVDAPAPSPTSQDWQKSVTPIDLGNGKASVQRSDGGVWFGPEQGNTGRAGWFDDKGNRLGDAPGQPAPHLGVMGRVGYGLKSGAQNVLDSLVQTGVQRLSDTTSGAVVSPAGVNAVNEDVAHDVGARNAAVNSLGLPAKTGRFISESAPYAAASVLAPEAPGAGLATRAAATGLGAAPIAFATTPGSSEEKAKAAAFSAPSAAVGQVVGEKVISPLLSKIVGKTYNLVTGASPNVKTLQSDLAARVAGEPADVFQADLESQYAAARARAAQPFNALREATGNTPVELPSYTKAVDDAIAAEGKSRAGSNKSVMAVLNDLKSGLDNPNADQSFSGTLDIGSRLNAIESDAMSGANPNRQVAKAVIQLKGALSKDMDAAGDQYGDAYKAAKDTWIKEVVPFEDRAQGGKLLQQFMNSPTPDTALRALAVAKSADKLNIFVKQLSPQGKQALQAGLVDTAFADAADPVTGKFRVDRFLKAVNDRQAAYGLTFSGEDKWRMDGLTKIAKAANLANTVIPFEKWGVGTSDILHKLLMTRPGSNLLLAASDLPANSPKLAQLAQKTAGLATPASTASAAAIGAQASQPNGVQP